jgi:hypothetical protein
MFAVINVFFVLLIAYSQYKQGKRNGMWSWYGFLAFLGAAGLFIFLFLVPVVNSTTLEAHPGAMMTIMFSGILVFVGALIWCARIYGIRAVKAQAAREQARQQSGGVQSSVVVLAIVLACAGAPQLHAQGKSVYRDPGGAYSVTVPAGWETQPQQGSPMVSIVNMNAKVSVTLGVMTGPAASTPTAEKELENMESQFPQSCPQAKILSKGAATLAGLKGVFVEVQCKGDTGPELMKYTTGSKPGAIALMISASPGNAYLKLLVPLAEIRESFKVTSGMAAQGSSGQGGHQAQQPMQSTGDPQNSSQASGAFADPSGSGSGSGTYHDPQGRYSLVVPIGWTATTDKSSGTLQLTHGTCWATVAGGGGSGASDVNRQIVQQIQGQYKDFQILNQGDFQNNGHPAHGTNATGLNPKGRRVSVLVVSIGAGNGNFLTIISSASDDQAKEINSEIMDMAKSIRFGGE